MILPFNFLRVEIKVKLARHNDVIPIYPSSNHGYGITLYINRFNHASHGDCRLCLLSFPRSTISCPLPPLDPPGSTAVEACWGEMRSLTAGSSAGKYKSVDGIQSRGIQLLYILNHYSLKYLTLISAVKLHTNSSPTTHATIRSSHQRIRADIIQWNVDFDANLNYALVYLDDRKLIHLECFPFLHNFH